MCSDTCRKRASRGAARTPGLPVEAGVASSVGPLEKATARKLDAADRTETDLGALALTLARKIDSPTVMESAVAALSKEYRAVMVEVMDGVAVASDPLDELRQRRDRKRVG